ncbi:type II toxin-antitoxin system RelE/ParE family toxin [Cardiobacteriaceae bacterium TAE3-ERU3]|nr:type II toxin-antitoxin system RelE/ParE family toxin [Cardiobacteriaceae bacterium TAE3-ERU3]
MFSMKYEITQTEIFAKWLRKLRDRQAHSIVLKRLRMIEVLGHFGDHKPISDGVSELRIRHGKGYRVYYTVQNEQVILLLVGGNKDTQDRDIKKARELMKELNNEE